MTEPLRPPSSSHASSQATRARALSQSELALLRAIREADEDRGGLFREELTADELDACEGLVEGAYAEVLSEYGEAPDGEEDERDAGGRYCFRITGRGVAYLAAAREAGGT